MAAHSLVAPPGAPGFQSFSFSPRAPCGDAPPGGSGRPRPPTPRRFPRSRASAAANPSTWTFGCASAPPTGRRDGWTTRGASWKARSQLNGPPSSDLRARAGLRRVGRRFQRGGPVPRYLDEHPDGALADELNKRRLELVRRRALQQSVDAALARESELASTPPQPRTVGRVPLHLPGDRRATPSPGAGAGRDALHGPVPDGSAQGGGAVAGAAPPGRDEAHRPAAGPARDRGPQRTPPGGGADRPGRPGRQRRRAADGGGGGPGGRAAARPGSPLSARDPARASSTWRSRSRSSIYQRMGIELTPAEREAVLHRPTENLDALLAFGLGLEAQDAGRFQEAATHFAEAARLDPGFHGSQRQGCGRRSPSSSLKASIWERWSARCSRTYPPSTCTRSVALSPHVLQAHRGAAAGSAGARSRFRSSWARRASSRRHRRSRSSSAVREVANEHSEIRPPPEHVGPLGWPCLGRWRRPHPSRRS